MAKGWKDLVTEVTITDSNFAEDGISAITRLGFNTIANQSAIERMKTFTGKRFIRIELDDPRMHAFNLGGEYRFSWDRDGNKFMMCNPVDTHLLNSSEFRCMIGDITAFFTDLFQATS